MNYCFYWLFLHKMYAYRVTGRAAEQFGGIRPVSRDFEITGTVDQDEQGTGFCLMIGLKKLAYPLIANLEKTKGGRIETSAADADVGADIAEMIDTLHLSVEGTWFMDGRRDNGHPYASQGYRGAQIVQGA